MIEAGLNLEDSEADRRDARRRFLLLQVATASAVAAVSGLAVWLAGGGPITVAVLAVSASFGFGLIFARFARKNPGLPILTYHSVSGDPYWLPWRADISIRPDSFDRQLNLFRRMGLQIIDTEEAVRARLAARSLPANAIALHFDDGYLDTWVAAAPILRRHGVTATVFVSTDFVAPDQPLRPTIEDGDDIRWDGYMSWRELRQLETSGLMRVEAHGTDHGRVVIGPRVIDRLKSGNARRNSWMQWASMPGDKHDWYLQQTRPVPLGSPVRESASALAARRWSPEYGLESNAAFDRRARATFATCNKHFQHNLGRMPVLFCWPHNETCARARILAHEAGFIATTGGRGRNAAQANPAILGRVHIGEDYAGFRCGWIDDLAVRAHIRCFQGYMGWAAVLAGVGLIRRIGKLARLPERRDRFARLDTETAQ